MSWSLNEIETLSRKAARGAGLSWGLAEEAGKATRWLSAAGLPGPQVLAELLIRNDGADYDTLCPLEHSEGHWTAKGGTLCPLISGAALCDSAARLASGDDLHLGRTACPVLLLPYLAAAVGMTGTRLTVTWRDVSITLDAETHIGPHDPEALNAAVVDAVHIARTETGELTGPLTPGNRGKMPPETARQLTAFARRTYAPATSESRLSGAGAGLTDND